MKFFEFFKGGEVSKAENSNYSPKVIDLAKEIVSNANGQPIGPNPHLKSLLAGLGEKTGNADFDYEELLALAYKINIESEKSEDSAEAA